MGDNKFLPEITLTGIYNEVFLFAELGKSGFHCTDNTNCKNSWGTKHPRDDCEGENAFILVIFLPQQFIFRVAYTACRNCEKLYFSFLCWLHPFPIWVSFVSWCCTRWKISLLYYFHDFFADETFKLGQFFLTSTKLWGRIFTWSSKKR